VIGNVPSYRILAKRVPLYARRVLHVNCDCGLLGEMVKTRDRGVEVFGIESESPSATEARRRLDGVVTDPIEDSLLPFRSAYFDCIVMSDPGRFGEGLTRVLTILGPMLARNGCVIMEADETLWPSVKSSPACINAILATAGWVPYMLWPWAEFGASNRIPKDFENPCPKWVCQALWPTYNPVAHAHALFDAGHPDWAYEVFCAIPPQYRTDPQVGALLDSEKQICLLAMDKPGSPYPQLQLFTGALMLFYDIVDVAPMCHESYQCQAEFWHRIGDDDMAARILRSVHHASPAAAVLDQAARYTRPSPVHEEAVPEWSGDWRPRILMLLPQTRSHYGLDVLYDGLCRVLGDDHVVEYPWRPSLHGVIPSRLTYYPCLFNRPGTARPFEQVLGEVRQGRFDLILFATAEPELDYTEARAIVQAAGDIPLFVLGAGDDCVNNLPGALALLGRRSVHGYFKRECLACADYGPDTFPFPFAYADEHVPEDLTGPRPKAMFWAGHRLFGMRRLYLQRMEAILGETFDATYVQDEYVAQMRASRMGVNIFGAGFDCVRYWELPANGCLLFSERPPIRIPHNFRDGETAVFFDDLKEFEDKLRHYIDHPDLTTEIARAGHEHFRHYHTGSARATQVLGYAEQALRFQRVMR